MLPFGDLATIGFFIAMAVAVHRGNLFRTLISGVIIMGITTTDNRRRLACIPNWLPMPGAKAGGQGRSLDRGGSPIARLLRFDFTAEYRRLRRHCHYLSGRRTADWRRARRFVAEKATAQQSQIASLNF